MTEAATLTEPSPAVSRDVVDFDLHGIVGIRLVGAGLREVKMITRQIGPIRASLKREPDITIRFVDEVPRSSKIRYLGVDDAGFTDDAFLVLRAKQKARAMVQIPFENIGRGLEIVCQRGLPAVPHLIAIVNLCALSNGALPLHASAFEFRGTGILTTGWAKGGKTEALLGFAANGARYVGDEWVYLTDDGMMRGIPEPIRIWDWLLDDYPRYQAIVPTPDRVRLAALKLLGRGLDAVSRSKFLGPIAKFARRVSPMLQKQRYVHLPPERLFGGIQRESIPRKLFWVASHETSDTVVTKISAAEIVERMVFSLQEERVELLTFYWKSRFAFPNRSNELIENAEEIQRDLLHKYLGKLDSYVVDHPYPASSPEMYRAMEPCLGEGDASVASPASVADSCDGESA